MPNSWRRSLALVALTVTASASLLAQQAVGTLAVKVTDSANQRPIEAARVFLVGSAIGAATNPEGRVTLARLAPGEYTVRVLRVGYAEQTKRATIVAGQTATLDFSIVVAAVNLTPVVTTATGEQRRVEIGNATANIDVGKVMETVQVGSISDLLNSRAPGVTVTTGTQTGTGSRIRVRGINSVSLSNEPIWIIDGIRMTSNRADFGTATGNGGGTGGNNASRTGDINPDEIENIEIVKGPSAATLYGTDAANGVILVTTKKGRAGAARWLLTGEGGAVTDRNFYPTAYTTWGKRPGETASTRGFCNLQRVGTRECTADSTSALDIFGRPDLTPVGTGNRNKLGLQVSGGSDILRYFVSGETESEIGVLTLPQFERQRADSLGLEIRPWQDRPNALGRKTIRMNLNAAVNPKLDVGISTNFINLGQRYSLESNATAGVGSQAFGGPGTTDNGAIAGVGTPLMGYRAWTPFYTWAEKTGQTVNRFIWSAQANYRPYSWLSNRATVGNDWTGRVDENLLYRGEGPPLTATTRLGSRGLNSVSINNLTVDAASTAQYSLTDALSLKTTVGAQYVGYRSLGASTGSSQLAPGSQNVSSGTALSVGEGTTIQRTFGVFVEQALAVRDRLFLTAAVRSDQNSAFGTNFQRVLYPKASMSYLISQEGWWKAPAFVNSVRLRYAYGQSGVQPGPNDALRFYTASTTSIANVDQPTVTQNALGNANLKPERSGEHETGFEVQMFGERLSLDATYYSKITQDALISAVLPPSYGAVASQFRNLGAVKNAGVELAITGQLVQTQNFGYDVNLSGSINANKVVSLGDTPAQTGTSNCIWAGQPISFLCARPITGYEDKNGDGLLTYFADAARNEVFVGDSLIYRGYATPRYQATLSNNVDLFNRKVRVGAMFDYRGGNKWYNNSERIRCTRPNCSGRMNLQADLIDQAANIAANEHSARTLDGYFQSGAFVRLREASVQYTFSNELTSKLIKGRSLSVVMTGRNLKLWTKYRGTDPESAFNLTGGGDAPSEFQTVGPPSYFVFRVNIGY